MAGVTTAVGTIVVQPVVVVAPLAAANGWGTAGADWWTAGQVEILPDNGQHTHPADMAVQLDVTTVVAIVVQLVAVTHEVEEVYDGEETVGDDVANLKQPKGLIMFPSASILICSNQIINFT